MRLQFLGNEIAFAILFLLKIYKNCVTAERICHACHGINCLRTSYKVTQNCVNDIDICVTVFEERKFIKVNTLKLYYEDAMEIVFYFFYKFNRDCCVSRLPGTAIRRVAQ